MDDSGRETERAIELAYRAVGYRERTVAELRAFLERKRVEPAAIEDAVAELSTAGFLDDSRYARRFAEDKRELDRWGSERIARELRRRGVPSDLVEGVVADRSGDSELAAAMLVLSQRSAPPGDDRERDRAWRLLVRRGYEAEIAYEAIRRYERAGDDDDGGFDGDPGADRGVADHLATDGRPVAGDPPTTDSRVA